MTVVVDAAAAEGGVTVKLVAPDEAPKVVSPEYVAVNV